MKNLLEVVLLLACLGSISKLSAQDDPIDQRVAQLNQQLAVASTATQACHDLDIIRATYGSAKIYPAISGLLVFEGGGNCQAHELDLLGLSNDTLPGYLTAIHNGPPGRDHVKTRMIRVFGPRPPYSQDAINLWAQAAAYIATDDSCYGFTLLSAISDGGGDALHTNPSIISMAEALFDKRDGCDQKFQNLGDANLAVDRTSAILSSTFAGSRHALDDIDANASSELATAVISAVSLYLKCAQNDSPSQGDRDKLAIDAINLIPSLDGRPHIFVKNLWSATALGSPILHIVSCDPASRPTADAVRQTMYNRSDPTGTYKNEASSPYSSSCTCDYWTWGN